MPPARAPPERGELPISPPYLSISLPYLPRRGELTALELCPSLALQANLEYRQLRDKLQDLEKEIAAKKAEEQALPNAQNADREIAELERTIGKERIEIANANGSLDTVRSRLEGTKKELRDVKYRHIDDEHRKKLIECKTTQVDPPAPPAWAYAPWGSRAAPTPAAYLP